MPKVPKMSKINVFYLSGIRIMTPGIPFDITCKLRVCLSSCKAQIDTKADFPENNSYKTFLEMSNFFAESASGGHKVFRLRSA
jgi:hypothetical protein